MNDSIRKLLIARLKKRKSEIVALFQNSMLEDIGNYKLLGPPLSGNEQEAYLREIMVVDIRKLSVNSPREQLAGLISKLEELIPGVDSDDHRFFDVFNVVFSKIIEIKMHTFACNKDEVCSFFRMYYFVLNTKLYSIVS